MGSVFDAESRVPLAPAPENWAVEELSLEKVKI